MKITVIAVGKLKEKFWLAACEEYLKRLQPYAKLNVVELSDRDLAKCGGERGSCEQEGKDILKVLPERAQVILLDREGR